MFLPIAPYPFLRLALFVIAGIFSYIYFPAKFQYVEYYVAGSTCLFVLTYLWNPRKALALGLLAYLFCFFLGGLICKWDTEILDPDHFANCTKKIDAYVAVVDDELVHKPKSISTTLRVRAVLQKGEWVPVKGNVLVYFPPENLEKNLQYGDWLLVKGSPSETQTPKNPGEFDYKHFLAYKNIYHQQYIKEGEFAWLKYQPPSSFWAFAFKARDVLSGMLLSAIGNGQEFAVTSMLVLGIRQSVDSELLNAYSSAGAIHVLAVSGMHVGLVFGLIQWLLGRLARNKVSSHLFYTLSLLAIWMFGMITAFSPSVLRAVVMFSVIILGKWMGRKGNLFNTLGFTAVVILLFSPYTLMNVGFQMSFMAVIGIAYFQPRLTPLLQPKAKIVQWTWEITCISTAAQLTTFPLALLYFNQFPTYFLLTNLWAIPLSTAILYLGIAFFVGSFIPFWKVFFGWMLKFSTALLNKSMFLVFMLPYSVQRTVYFDKLEIVFVYLMIISSVLLFKMKDKRFVALMIVLALFFSCSRLAKRKESQAYKKLIIFSIRKETCFAVVEGRMARVWSTRNFQVNTKALEFHLLNPLRTSGVENFVFDSLPNNNFIWKWEKIKMLVIQKKINDKKIDSLANGVDYIFVANACTNLTDLASFHNLKHVILYSQKCQNSFEKTIKTWDLQTNGAFVLDLSPDGKYFTRD